MYCNVFREVSDCKCVYQEICPYDWTYVTGYVILYCVSQYIHSVYVGLHVQELLYIGQAVRVCVCNLFQL